jgi:hypothetical protein
MLIKERDWLDVTAIEYLLRIKNEVKRSDRPLPEDQNQGVATAGNGGDQDNAEDHRTRVAAVPAIEPAIDVREHDVRKHKRRSPQQILAAREAAQASVEAIYESRRIGNTWLGDLRWYELRVAINEKAMFAASHLQRGIDDAETAVLLSLIESSAQVDDDTKRIREVVSASALKRLEDKAKLMTPKLIETGMRNYAETIKQHKEIEAS